MLNQAHNFGFDIILTSNLLKDYGKVSPQILLTSILYICCSLTAWYMADLRSINYYLAFFLPGGSIYAQLGLSHEVGILVGPTSFLPITENAIILGIMLAIPELESGWFII